MIISKKTLSVLLLTSLLLDGCGEDNASTTNKHIAKAHKVEVSIASTQDVQHRQVVTGSLEAIYTLKLYSEESSRITSLPFHESDAVKKGEMDIAIIQGTEGKFLIMGCGEDYIIASVLDADARMDLAFVNMRKTTGRIIDILED